MAVLRRNAVYITLPVAALVGFVGYNLENLLSDKYTPFSSELSWLQCLRKIINLSLCLCNPAESIQDNRAERLGTLLEDPEKVEKLRLKGNVLERNLSPSLQKRAE